ncbi:MAG TPA: ABC transporter permease [Dongiaceae bacterium]|jgi:ribose transport system permease protein|nr:ABC transporter permease [Dongiaceae bacterium]
MVKPGRSATLPRYGGLFRSSRGIALATAGLFAISWLLYPESLATGALSGMVPFAAILALVALGQTLVLQQGGIDLSVPSIVSLSAVILTYSSVGQGDSSGAPLWLAIAYAFGAAALAGLVSGLLVSKGGVAPIVATIGMNALLYGINVRISGGTPVSMPDGMLRFVNIKILGVSVLAYVAVIVTAVIVFIVKETVFGRRYEAAGANPRTARAAGIAISRYQTAAYVAAAMLYCMGGIFLGALMQLPSAFQGDVYLMPSIAAAVLGGTSLFGGKGNLAATVIAAIFLTQLQQLVLITGASVGVQYLFQGCAIIVGVGVYSVRFADLKRLFAHLVRREPHPGARPA